MPAILDSADLQSTRMTDLMIISKTSGESLESDSRKWQDLYLRKITLTGMRHSGVGFNRSQEILVGMIL